MQGLWIAYLTAFALGANHALEVDHMVAVTTFVGGQPRLAPAIGFGVRWALGHSLVVLVVGAALALSGLRVPLSAQDWGEVGVGVMLVALGIWAMRAAQRLHIHAPPEHGDHAHLHAHPHGSAPHVHRHHDLATRRHRHLPTMVGAFHGLAGTVPVVALIPVTLMPSRTAAIGYLAAFGVGTVLGMGAYAALAAMAVSRVATTARIARAAAFATAGASLAVGLWWITTGVATLRH